MNNETEIALLELEHRYGKEVRDRVEQMGFEVVKHGRWIPVTERLPEEGKDVIVSVHFDVPGQRRDKGWYVDIASQIDGDWVSYSDEYKVARNLHKVMAWMPLPEPWKGADNDK